MSKKKGGRKDETPNNKSGKDLVFLELSSDSCVWCFNTTAIK